MGMILSIYVSKLDVNDIVNLYIKVGWEWYCQFIYQSRMGMILSIYISK